MKLPVSAICVILLLVSCKGDRNKPYRIPDLPQKTGDQPAVVDSLIRQLRQNDLHDTSRAKSMMTLAINYETVDSTLADQTYQQGIQFSKSKDLHFFTGMLYHNKAYFYWTNGSREKALVYMDSAQYYMEKSDHPKRDLNIAATWGVTANIWREMGDYKKAIEYGYKAIRMYEKIGAIYKLPFAYVDMANYHKEMNEFEKEETCARKALEASRLTGVPADFFASYYRIGLALNMQNRYKEADIYLDSAAHYYDDNFKSQLLVSYHLVRGLVDMNLNQLDSAEVHSAWVVNASKNNSQGFGKIQGLLQTARVLTLKKSYPEAEKLLNEAEREIKKGAAYSHLEVLLDYQSRLYEDWGKSDKALAYYKEYKAVTDSMASEQNKHYASQLEVEFETEKKESQIKLQQASIHQKNILNYVFAGSTILVLLLTFLIYRTYQQRRKLQQQRIQELETEKQLLATQSLLKGQEDERSRLAKDLHDGLGGLLSGVKLQLGAMKGNLILTEEHGRIFNNALIKLDESISEMRRVAHNMMPEALMKLGLQHALQDYCESLSQSQPFRIETAFYGLENRLEPSVEIVVYRIVQELVNNAVKHSGATTILAQVMSQDNLITITVEDNGKGFEQSQLEEIRTAGMQNIQSRVNYLRGTIDIQSSPGKGTSVHIECPVDGAQQA
jgi:two-component system NarL family sensor kinase